MSADRRLHVLLAGVLLVGTLAVYAGVGQNGFVAYDDDVYVTANEVVRRGLTADGVRWAFGASHGSNWHPVTWLSHMLDVELYGLQPAGHHATSVTLHAATGLLLFAFLCRTTRRPWPAFLCAALFLWHPLRVESVAWVAERKDVLAGLFFGLTLLAYTHWCARPSPGRYAFLLAALAAGLMSKPMLVTTPCVLLLVDAWPLKRLQPFDRASWRRRVLEKVPLFLLAALVAAAAYLAQASGGTVIDTGGLPPVVRLLNALRSVGVYVRQFFWPTGLACFHPHAQAIEEDPVAALLPGALLSALGVTLALALAWRARRAHRYVLVGSLWYLGMLVPVIGLVQVGQQAHADRYTYLPGIGLAVIVAWGLADVVAARPRLGRPAMTLVLALLSLLLVLSARQVTVWRDSVTLFEHAVRMTRDNHRAHANLGVLHLRRGDHERALVHLEASVAILPTDRAALEALAEVRTALGLHAEALDPLEVLRAARPGDASLHARIAAVARRAGRERRALRALRTALRLGAEDPALVADTAWLLATARDPELREPAEALRLARAHRTRVGETLHALETLAAAHAATGAFEEAARLQALAVERAGPGAEVREARRRLTAYRSGEAWVDAD